MTAIWIVDKKWVKPFLKGLFLLIVVITLLGIRERYHIHTLEDLHLFAQEFSDPETLILSFLAVTLVASLCFVPISIFKAFAGIYFGFIYGFVIAFSAALLSATLSFVFARFIGKEGVELLYQKRMVHRLSKKQRTWMERLGNPGFFHVILLRNLYFLPFTPVNYLLGVSKISFSKYLGATILGMFPGTLSYVYFFSQALSIREDPLGIWPILLGVPIYYYLLWKIRKMKGDKNFVSLSPVITVKEGKKCREL